MMTPKNTGMLGQIIKRHRILEGFTLVKASEVCGVSASQLSRFERGCCFPSAKFLKKIAGPLNINESLLLACVLCLAMDENRITDKYLREITNALKISLANDKSRRLEIRNGLLQDSLSGKCQRLEQAF